MTTAAHALVDAAVARPGLVTVLTGAGISAASGIPTFRGPEGYWTAGASHIAGPGPTKRAAVPRPSLGPRNYTPMQLATHEMFRRAPEVVWAWYLYRLGVCRTAQPNAAHVAVTDLERALGDRFLLITQNVDGLHLRAGTSAARTYPVHGELEWVRCADECTPERLRVPDAVSTKQHGQPLTDADRTALRCPRCGGWLRPHVLWFDETYDEERFFFDSALRAAADTTLLITVGTSGATTLPTLVAERAVATGATLLDVNPERSPFGDLAERRGGAAVRAPATEALPDLVSRITTAAG